MNPASTGRKVVSATQTRSGAEAVKSRCKRFGAIGSAWLESVVRFHRRFGLALAMDSILHHIGGVHEIGAGSTSLCLNSIGWASAMPRLDQTLIRDATMLSSAEQWG